MPSHVLCFPNANGRVFYILYDDMRSYPRLQKSSTALKLEVTTKWKVEA